MFTLPAVRGGCCCRPQQCLPTLSSQTPTTPSQPYRVAGISTWAGRGEERGLSSDRTSPGLDLGGAVERMVTPFHC